MNYKNIIDLIFKFIPHPQAIELNKWIDLLRKEKEELRDEIHELKKKIEELKSPAPVESSDVPTCPNCSTTGKAFYMRSVPIDFVEIMNATHECPKCKYNTKAK